MGILRRIVEKKKADLKKGASSESQEKGDAYCMEELFLVTPSSVTKVRYVDP